MRTPWFTIRAVAVLVFGCTVTIVVASAALKSIRARINGGKVGEIARRVQIMTPDVDRRDKEVEELTRP
jgi:hypothetical protein